MGEGQVGCGPTCGHAGGGCTETVGDLPARILPSLPQVILKGSSVPRRGRGTPHTLPASWLSRQAGREWPPYPLPRPRPAVGSCRIKERKFGFGFPSGTCRVILRISSKVTPLLPTLQLTGACPCRGGAAQAQPFGVPVWASAPAPRAGRPGRHLVLWVTPHPGWWEVGLLACQVGGAAYFSSLCTRGTHTSNPNCHLQDLMASQLCTTQGGA